MRRFPKGLVLLAVLAELMILTVASRTEILSSHVTETKASVTMMSVAPALPNQSVSRGKQVQLRQVQAPKPQSGQVITIQFDKAPRPVM